MNITRELLVEKLVDYIKKNFNNGLCIKIFAQQLNINPVYLSYVFRRVSGKSIRKFVEDCRIEKFNEIINDGNEYYGYEVGNKLGFKNEFQFYRWVKKVYSQTYIGLGKNPPPQHIHIQKITHEKHFFPRKQKISSDSKCKNCIYRLNGIK